MERQSKVKSRRKIISPVFHLQTKEENEQHINKDVIKNVRKTGQLNLSNRHLSVVPEKMFSMYEQRDENDDRLDFNKVQKEDDLWWNIKPLTNLDLSSNVLTSLPNQIGMFQDLVVLNLQDNNLTELPPDIGHLTKITKLNLNNNKINKLPKEMYKLTELKQLLLCNNTLDCISKSVGDLVMLEKLDLSKNQLTKLPSGMGFLIRLSELDLSSNKLASLPPDIVNLRNLLKLDVNRNNLTCLPDLCELRKLQILYAQHNDIEKIPDFTGCEQVQEIYFGNNFLEEIPLEFCDNLAHLKILELRDNKIELVPKEIKNMFHLNKLDLTNNDIRELPAVLGLMPHLQSLKVEGNKLKSIRPDVIQSGTNRLMKFLREKLSEEDLKSLSQPTDVSYDSAIFPDRYTMRNGNIFNLTMKDIAEVPEECFIEAKEAKVTTVDLCKNRFTEVPSSLTQLSDYLTELNLSANRFKEIPSFLSEFKKLKFLDVSKNMLSALPDSFSEMSQLREIVLSNNKFTEIPKCIFDMIGLEILLLNDNSINNIDIDGLKNLKRLAVLNLTNNNINFVPPQLGNITQLRSLEMKGNPFKQPRYAILDQGTESILSYLRDRIPT